MTICIDARLWSHAGIGRYVRELIFAIKKEPAEFHFNILGPEKARQELITEHNDKILFTPAASPIYSLGEQWEIFLKSRRARLLHVPHFNMPIFCEKKLVVTIHDLIYLRDQSTGLSGLGKAYAKMMFAVMQKKASMILAVSEHTKNDLLNYFPKLSPERVTVTYEAASPIFKPVSDSSSLEAAKLKHGLQGPFILFVGSLKPHKNLSTLMRAAASLRKDGKIGHELVIVGRRDLKHPEIFSEIQANASFVRYLGELPDNELVNLYNLADLFVLPSLHEGFGLPVIEAMACGTPVICSNRDSLPEVLGEAGLLFDPARVDALSDLLYNVLQNQGLKSRMSKMGIDRASFFSWEKTGRETLAVYRKVLA